MSLARALSKLGLASRADAVRLIEAGRVRVDDRVERRPHLPVVPERIRVAIDDRTPHVDRTRRIVILHKPRGTMTTRRDPQGRPTVFDVLGAKAGGLMAVGRLDRASTGLLVLTNDSQLAHRLADPATRLPRQYVVTMRGRVTAEDIHRLEAGCDVSGPRGVEHLQPSVVRLHKASGRESHVIVELLEGRNREIRRLCEAIGHEATRVHRVSFGPFTLGSLAPGAWRPATSSEELAAERLQPALRRPPIRTE